MRVVIATDGSVEADIAGVVLKRLPFPKGTTFTVAMVTHMPVVAAIGKVPGMLNDGYRAMTDSWQIERNLARQTTERVAQRLIDEGFDAEGVVLEGDTAEELLKLVNDDHADVIAAGCGVNSNLAAFFLGSVSRKLVLYADSSVVIGRKYSGTPTGGSYNQLKSKSRLDVLVAVDGSKGSELALESLAAVSEPVFRNAYVLAVEPVLYLSPGIDAALLLPDYEEDKARTERLAAGAAERIARCAEKVESLGAFGRPSAEICRVAGEKGVDLIMMGANRHGALERFIVGSCAYETATGAPCSVLILRDVLPFGE